MNVTELNATRHSGTDIALPDGRSVPRIGVGGWAMGGPFFLDGRPDGWGDVDDAQSVRALELAYDLGARIFDTADVYGTGHSETVLGRALAQRRSEIYLATKFGYLYDEATRHVAGSDVSPAYIGKAVQASLRRLGTDYIDLYQIHVGGLAPAAADAAGEALERLAETGAIRAWGWSTDDAAAARRMLAFPHFAAVQQELSLFCDGPNMLALCEANGLLSLNRSPLAMGFLTGKFGPTTAMPASDVRGAGHDWVRFFKHGRPLPEFLTRLDAVRELLRSGGRTLAQGALGWILARSPQAVPIPGFKTESQVRDNLGALQKGPLSAATMAEIAHLLAVAEDA
ncbi:Aldo-keto reductase [Devosia sp. DBB001]|nr:Aldo-keto reductase [Devosia sp. DBB001]